MFGFILVPESSLVYDLLKKKLIFDAFLLKAGQGQLPVFRAD
jgi:hypothetical protein